LEHFLSLVFLCFSMHIYIFFHCGLHSLEVLHNKWCPPHYVCIMWKETIERINEPKRKKNVLFPSMFFLCFFLGPKKYFEICFDNLINFCASHHYYITLEPYDIDPFIHLHGYSYFKRERKKPKHLKLGYLSNYLSKMKQKIK
jgi:hypothetical protein